MSNLLDTLIEAQDATIRGDLVAALGSLTTYVALRHAGYPQPRDASLSTRPVGDTLAAQCLTRLATAVGRLSETSSPPSTIAVPAPDAQHEIDRYREGLELMTRFVGEYQDHHAGCYCGACCMLRAAKQLLAGKSAYTEA